MRSDSVFSTSSLLAYLSLILLYGIALALSIQPPARIAAFHASNLSYPSGLFPIVAVVLFGLFAVNRGSIVAANVSTRIKRLKPVLRFIEPISYGLILLFPYFVYSRALLSGRTGGIIVLVTYTAVSSLFFCLTSFQLELRANRERRSAFLLRYGLYAACCLVPLGIGVSHRSLSLVLSASPIGIATQIIRGASASELFVGFLVPSMGILWILTRCRRPDRRHHAI